MYDMAILRERGADDAGLKKVFTASGAEEKLKPLIDRISSRTNEGVSYNLKNYKLYYALDLAWNTPMRQASYTLLQSLMNKKAESEEVTKALQDWGLTHEVLLEADSKTVNIPAFCNIFVPIVRAYLTIRWARIMNDLRLHPFLKYEPQHQVQDDIVKCEVVTDRVQLISQQYDYFSVLKQAVFQMLHYGHSIMFPMESWNSEEQEIRGDGGKVETKCVKEGIRYAIPHPTRTYMDMAHRPSTLNSDTGVEFCGYWTVKRWRDIRLNKAYWSTEKVSKGATDWIGTNPTYWNTVGGCVINFVSSSTSGSIQNPGPLDREKDIGFYTSDDDDQPVLLVEHFEKISNPKDEGLFDYEHPVWMRFVLAGDRTIIFAEVIPYQPGPYFGYDSNENQRLNASLSLEVLPFQDQVSNVLSQYLLSVKQNLSNLNLLNSDVLGRNEEEQQSLMDKLNNFGEKWFRKLNFVWFSERKVRMVQSDISRAVQSFRFTQLDTSGLIVAIRQIVDLLERALVMSAQEVAQAASHEQTAEEVRNIAQTTSSRLLFTATPVHQAIYAWKNRIYRGLMAYGEEEFYSQLSTPISSEKLQKLGFTVEQEWDEKTRRAVVKATKSAVAIESFASTRDGDDRIRNEAIAAAMAQVLQAVIGNERLFNAIGDNQAIELINMVNKYLGLPRDFVLRNATGGIPPKEQLAALLQAMQQGILGQVSQGIQPVIQSVAGLEQAVGQVGAQTQANSEQIANQAQLVAQISQVIKMAAEAPMAGMMTNDAQLYAPTAGPAPVEGGPGLAPGPQVPTA